MPWSIKDTAKLLDITENEVLRDLVLRYVEEQSTYLDSCKTMEEAKDKIIELFI